ncbi:glycosyltransferase family 2 protein [Phenylobacterium sp.]|uniref:glycosyltransferase family 2 protein n=1 Tax=Phenylobacterium sp. TaxID=1871053 RepID=UPI003982F06D
MVAEAAAFLLLHLAEPVILIVIVFGLTQNAVYLVLYGVALQGFVTDPPAPTSPQLWRRYGSIAPPVSILAPAYNEAPTIVESVRSLLALQYADFEVVVINDGSTDETLARLVEAFELEPIARGYDAAVTHAPIIGLWSSPSQPKLLIIDKENGGKGDALNAGLNLARSPVVCAIDSDSLLERDALLRATRPFIEDPERMVAVGGAVRIANGCRVSHGRVQETGLSRNPLALFQTVEYLRAFLMGRVGWSRMGVLTLISGAFGLFSRTDLVAVGGWRTDTVGEDFELVIKLHKHLRREKRDYRMVFVPEPVCWTEAPETLRALANQRARWQRGLIETTVCHRSMTLNPRYGRIGLIGFAHLWLLDIVAPVIEVLGYVLAPVFWFAGLLSTEFFLAYLLLTFVFGIVVSLGAVLLEELELRRYPKLHHLMILAGAAVLENFGYRQLHNLWRLRGLWQYLRGRDDWGEMTRKGFRPGAPAGPAGGGRSPA